MCSMAFHKDYIMYNNNGKDKSNEDRWASGGKMRRVIVDYRNMRTLNTHAHKPNEIFYGKKNEGKLAIIKVVEHTPREECAECRAVIAENESDNNNNECRTLVSHHRRLFYTCY